MTNKSNVSQMSMLDFFYINYSIIKSNILNSEPDDWNSLKITYETPNVDRLWLEIDSLPKSIWSIPDNSGLPTTKYRLLLHKIYPCDSAFYHPHPWASVCHILHGLYRMEIGTSNCVFNKYIISTNSSYEMTNSSLYHSVFPLENQPVYSIMLLGNKYNTKSKSPEIQRIELSKKDKQIMLYEFYGLLTRK